MALLAHNAGCYTEQKRPYSYSGGMITVLSGTDRVPSHTAVLADFVAQQLRSAASCEVNRLDLAALRGPLLLDGQYKPSSQSDQIRDLQDRFILPARAFYIIVPEYNGSFPGILKYFLDACSVRAYASSFQGKKAGLLGLSTGRAGNLRGLEHLTGILQYLNITVMPNRLPLSKVETLLHDQQLTDPEAVVTVKAHVATFLDFCS